MVNIPRLIMVDDHVTPAPVISIVPTTPHHIAALKANLQKEDVAEILRLGVSVQHALWQSYRNSLTRKTALIDGVVAACWGVHGTFMGHTGTPWLVTSPEIRRISPLKFVRIYQEEVFGMLEIFPRLENFVDAEYDGAIRLLEIIGFKLGKPEKIRNGLFRKFSIEA